MEALNFVTAHLSTILSIGELDEVTVAVGLNVCNGVSVADRVALSACQRGHFVTLFAGTLVASDVKFNAVAHDVTRYVVAQSPQQTLHRSGPELSDVPADDADRVVMVLDAGQAVPGSAVHQVKPTDDSGFHQEFDRSKDSRPAYAWQLMTNLLCGEPPLFPIQDLYYGAPRSRGAISTVFKDCHNVWA